MSVTVQAEQNHHRPKFRRTRSFNAFRFAAHLLELFCATASIVCLVAVVWQFISTRKVAADFFIFLQWCTVFAIFGAIFHQAKAIFKAAASKPSFPFHEVAHGLRVVAALWLALVLIGLLFGILAAFTANGSFPLVNIDLMLHSFPAPQIWYAAFGQPGVNSVSHVVSIDLASAPIGAIL